ncbi:MAG: DMT family transporter [Actinomycetota bacterium]|nr:DMT family transporter [Actinomycetota bacterium]
MAGARQPSLPRLITLAVLAMAAFAANSVLARLALDRDHIDAATFTLVRLASGAVVLWLLVRGSTTDSRAADDTGSWLSATMLFAYAATFSFAYLSLGAATGALVLFAVVQAVVFTAALRAGERPGWAGWTGLGVALAGLVALVAPGVAAPDPAGVVLMAGAGVAWGFYSLRGRGSTAPVADTAGNFVRSVPLAVALSVVLILLGRGPDVNGATGMLLAVLSGAVASGLGYALWYTVLPWLTRVQSGIVQLAPAPLATFAGLALLGEPITARVLVASAMILGGVLLGVVRQRERTAMRA